MGTRCTVHFKHGTYLQAIVYRHWDGYPDEESGMLHTLQSFFAEVEEQTKDTRFHDPSYLAAKYVIWQASEYTDDKEKPLAFLSVGICQRDPDDIEYRYTVDCAQRDERGRPTVTYEWLHS